MLGNGLAVSVRLVLGGVVAICLGCLAGYGSYAVVSIYLEGGEIENAEPVRVLVDLSQRGVTEAAYRQTVDGMEGVLRLHVEGETPSDVDLLDGLQGMIEIFDPQGTCVARSRLNPYAGMGAADVITQGLLPDFAAGQYTLRLQVDEPAPALAGKVQTLHGKYDINSGLRGMLTGMLVLFTVACGVLAVIVGGLTWRRGWEGANT